MASDSESDDLTEEEEVEEKEVFLELDSKQEYGDNPHVEFLGLDQDKPLMNINGITYKGTWEDALGTILFLEDTQELESYHPLLRDDLNYVLDVKYKTNKLLKMSRCVIVKSRENVEDIRTIVKQTAETDQYSSEEENLDEYYSAMIEPENLKELTEPLTNTREACSKDVQTSGESGTMDEVDTVEETFSQDLTDQFEQKADLSSQSEGYNLTFTSDSLLDRSQALLSGLESESYLYNDYQTDSPAIAHSPGPSDLAARSSIKQEIDPTNED